MPRAGYSSAGPNRRQLKMCRWPLIDVQGLTKRYGGRTAVADLTFSVPSGQALGLLGPDGAGKSTVLRVLAGSLGPTAGAARVSRWDLERRARAACQRARCRTGALSTTRGGS